MQSVIDSERFPIKLWLDDIEDGALDQVKNLANLPFVFKHIAAMPGAHEGYGMPIECVMATKGVVIPNAVGVDIGCGMCATKTNIREHELDKTNIKKILGGSKEFKGGIRSTVPVGFKKQSKKQDICWMPSNIFRSNFLDTLYEKSLSQIGTLGGGNHFIEIQKGSDGFIWIMIHSGSRKLGYDTAKHYNDIAIKLNKKWFTQVPKKWDLAFLPIDTDEGQDYLQDMKYCVDFALANRELMMHNVMGAFMNVYPDIKFDKMINVAHNYAAMEHHFGENVMVHRKGATRAYPNEMGIIPGSQGTKSYIVSGKGERESFMSCSHGAGRKMGRKQAERELNLEEEKKKLDDLGVIHSVRNKSDLDEAPGAYKDISVVMNNQKDLVNIEIELTPLAVIKG